MHTGNITNTVPWLSEASMLPRYRIQRLGTKVYRCQTIPPLNDMSNEVTHDETLINEMSIRQNCTLSTFNAPFQSNNILFDLVVKHHSARTLKTQVLINKIFRKA